MEEEGKKVVFETDNLVPQSVNLPEPAPYIVRLVKKYSGGAIKEDRQATQTLIGISVFMIILSIFLFIKGGSGDKPQPGKVPLNQSLQR